MSLTWSETPEDTFSHDEVHLFQTNLSFVNLTTDLVGLQATIGEPFKVLVDISIPAPSTPGVATPYVLEVLAPFLSTAIFKLCAFEIVNVGRDLPCVNKDELVATYYSRATSTSSLADRATIDLGKIFIISIKVIFYSFIILL